MKMRLERFAAALAPLVVFATVGCDRHDSSPSSAAPGINSASAAAPSSVVRVTADDRGFTPSSIAVNKGQPTTLQFVRTSDSTCAKEVVVPALHIHKSLPLNTPVDIPLAADDEKTYAFACGMGMLKGQVVVR
jgi:plastocyanin domain-containing protein